MEVEEMAKQKTYVVVEKGDVGHIVDIVKAPNIKEAIQIHSTPLSQRETKAMTDKTFVMKKLHN